MKRILSAAFLMIAAIPAWAGTLPVTLKPQAIIQSDVVKLGDIWENLGDKADIVLAGAPQPGKRIVAEARWLVAVAQANDINWQPSSSFDRIAIERAGRLVDQRLIETELRDALAMEGATGNFDFEVSNRSAMNIMVPADVTAPIAIRDMNWDQRTHRFNATLEVPSSGGEIIRQRLSGRVFETARIPVLAHAMNRGDIIAEADVKWIEVRSDQVRSGSVTDIDQIIGQEPRSQLRADAPLRSSDLRRPVLVDRNGMVTVSLRTPFMALTTQGKALEAGGKGDVIRITNLQSKRTVEAVVEGPGLVSVTPGGPRLLTN